MPEPHHWRTGCEAANLERNVNTAMARILRAAFPAICLAVAPAAAQDDWTAIEKVETYAISGDSGPALYASIGARGPKLGPTRAIAYTNPTLTWRRDYQKRGDSCVLVTARPKLTIVYKLPKPAGKLPAETAARWKTFIDGIAAHERVHGDFLKEMVGKIVAATEGLTVQGDPGCTKIREEVVKHVGALFQIQRQQGRDFDRAEMSDGGNVHQLILGLVNG